MITSVDSSALLAIFNAEADAVAWLDILVRARREGRLILCEIVFAELTPAFSNRAELEARLDSMGATVVPLDNFAAWEAGMAFSRYRRSGGSREHLIPDFLIAAHGQVQADRLAAADRGYTRQWFPNLRLLTPNSAGHHE